MATYQPNPGKTRLLYAKIKNDADPWARIFDANKVTDTPEKVEDKATEQKARDRAATLGLVIIE